MQLDCSGPVPPLGFAAMSWGSCPAKAGMAGEPFHAKQSQIEPPAVHHVVKLEVLQHLTRKARAKCFRYRSDWRNCSK